MKILGNFTSLFVMSVLYSFMVTYIAIRILFSKKNKNC